MVIPRNGHSLVICFAYRELDCFEGGKPMVSCVGNAMVSLAGNLMVTLAWKPFGQLDAENLMVQLAVI